MILLQTHFFYQNKEHKSSRILLKNVTAHACKTVTEWFRATLCLREAGALYCAITVLLTR